MLNTDFTDNIVKALKQSEVYLDNREREYDIALFQMVMDRFDVESFLENTDVESYFYNKYLKDVVFDINPSLHQKVIDDFEDDDSLEFLGFTKEIVFEMIKGNDNLYNGFDKEKMIGLLDFLFDKVDIETVYKNTEISKDEYEKYLKNVILKYKPNYHNEVMERFKEEENEN